MEKAPTRAFSVITNLQMDLRFKLSMNITPAPHHVPLFRPARDRPAAPVTERQVGGHRGLLLPRQRHPRTQLHMEEEWEETALHRL